MTYQIERKTPVAGWTRVFMGPDEDLTAKTFRGIFKQYQAAGHSKCELFKNEMNFEAGTMKVYEGGDLHEFRITMVGCNDV